jgi:hypothetical protein
MPLKAIKGGEFRNTRLAVKVRVIWIRFNTMV